MAVDDEPDEEPANISRTSMHHVRTGVTCQCGCARPPRVLGTGGGFSAGINVHTARIGSAAFAIGYPYVCDGELQRDTDSAIASYANGSEQRVNSIAGLEHFGVEGVEVDSPPYRPKPMLGPSLMIDDELLLN